MMNAENGSHNDAFELLSIASSLNSTLDLDFLLQKIGLAAERLLDSEASSIMLLDDSKKFLYFKIAGGSAGAALKKLTVPVGKGIAGLCAETRSPIVVTDAQSDDRVMKTADKTSGFVTRSLMAIPMICRGELVGVAEVLNKREGTYTQDDQALMSSLANLAAVAVANAKLIQEQKNFFSHVLEILSASIETSRPRMTGHPAISARLSCAIGRLLGIEEAEYKALYYAGILHDIGYIGMRNSRLSAEMGTLGEPAEELHPRFSVKMLEGIAMLRDAIPIIRHHHERFDGQGYPSKLSGEDIPLGARILGLVEAMEEIRMMTGLTGGALVNRAVQDAKDGSGNRFDPDVVQAFIELVESDDRAWEM